MAKCRVPRPAALALDRARARQRQAVPPARTPGPSPIDHVSIPNLVYGTRRGSRPLRSCGVWPNCGCCVTYFQGTELASTLLNWVGIGFPSACVQSRSGTSWQSPDDSQTQASPHPLIEPISVQPLAAGRHMKSFGLGVAYGIGRSIGRKNNCRSVDSPPLISPPTRMGLWRSRSRGPIT